MDEYVLFVKKYMSDPNNVTSMYKQYTELMEKYTVFAEEIEKLDSVEMSEADALYYLEVTNRCTQKMLEIYFE